MNPHQSRLLRRPAVMERTGLSRSSLYALIADRRFPPPVKLSLRAVAWHEAEVEAWIAARPLAGPNTQTE